VQHHRDESGCDWNVRMRFFLPFDCEGWWWSVGCELDCDFGF
jgi:hypothetical protein